MVRCPFCAEEIQDRAILCRFCGARKEGEAWKPPAKPPAVSVQPVTPPLARPARGGSLTLRGAGAMLLFSAVFELSSPFADVPLFGALRGGAVALAYHVSFAAMYAAMGIGLLMLRPFGYRLVFAGTLLCTLDRAIWLLDRRAQEAYVAQQVPGSEGLIDEAAVARVALLTSLAVLVSWWGFAAYVYFRRAAFAPPAPPPPSETTPPG